MIVPSCPSVGVDGYNIAMPHGTGVATYGRMLVHALKDMGYATTGVFGIDAGDDPKVAAALFYDRFVTPPVLARGARATARRWIDSHARGFPIVDVAVDGTVVTDALADRLPAFDRIVTSARLFERAHKRFRRTKRFTTVTLTDPPAIMHWTYPVPLRIEGARNIYTIHDLVPLRLPYTTRDDKLRYHALIAHCIETADRICTVSENSRRDIETLFPRAIGKTVTTYQVSGLSASDPADRGTVDGPRESAATRAFGLTPDGYFLFYGATEPKKNIGRLLEAYLGLDTETPLVLVSGRSWHDVDELALVNAEHGASGRHRDNPRIIRIDHLRPSILSALVAGARAVTFPSLYEGFGLPVHEAMLLGTPVLAANTSSLPEITGDAAILVDPYDVGAIRAGLAWLDGDPALRQTLRQAGRTVAAGFSLQAYVARLQTLYDGTAASRTFER